MYRPNNQVEGKKPVEVGYELSTVGLSCRQPFYGVRYIEFQYTKSNILLLVLYGWNVSMSDAIHYNER